MTRVLLLGAGGKMGTRLSKNLIRSQYAVDHVEVTEEGRQRLKTETGLECVEAETAYGTADVVLMAVPDNLIGRIATNFIDKLKPGACIMVLDAAAPYAGEMPDREDIAVFATHPCHPPLFRNDVGDAAQADYFGGDAAEQNIVCGLLRGTEDHYTLCEDIARTIFSPVMRAHRCTIEQLAILEPALSETVGATMALALRDATDMAITKGVPGEAAMDFIIGHLGIELAIAFDQFDGVFSDGALHAINQAKKSIFQEGWLERVFEPEAVLTSVKEICSTS
ncbi:MAG: semialdehyde dehydrogenase [Acidimicrobiia bacterium]|nr:semialdehyde dehydrogenase [Acidimicrobiia bacterium]